MVKNKKVKGIIPLWILKAKLLTGVGRAHEDGLLKGIFDSVARAMLAYRFQRKSRKSLLRVSFLGAFLKWRNKIVVF